MTTIIIIDIVLLVFAGYAKAVNNTLMHHYYDSVFCQVSKEKAMFWNPSRSWKNKYKDWDRMDRRPKFFGATTFLAWTTDAWHLFDTIQLTCLQSAGILPILFATQMSSWYFIPAIIVVKAICGGTFEGFYKAFRKKK
jgi:hypothetical protein